MQLNAVEFGSSQPIDGYGADFFRIAGQVFPAPLILTPQSVAEWGGYDDVAALLALAGQTDVLFIGTGPEIAPLPSELRARLQSAGLAVEIMASAPACRTYNVLLAEGRRIAIALLPAGPMG